MNVETSLSPLRVVSLTEADSIGNVEVKAVRDERYERLGDKDHGVMEVRWVVPRDEQPKVGSLIEARVWARPS